MSMKKSLRIVAGASLLGVVFLLSACPWCRKHGIVILPTQKSYFHLEQKWAPVKGALAKYSDEIYLIRTYNNGTPMPNDTFGKMDELLLERPIKQFDHLAADNRFTGHAVQIGVGLCKVETDVRFVGKEPREKGHGANDDSSGESSQPSPSPTPDGSSGKSSSHAHAVGVYGRTSSHAHLIQLVDESADLIKEIDPIIAGSGDRDDKP